MTAGVPACRRAKAWHKARLAPPARHPGRAVLGGLLPPLHSFPANLPAVNWCARLFLSRGSPNAGRPLQPPRAYDTFFYWLHRWSHRNKWIFRWVHGTHHDMTAVLSVVTTGAAPCCPVRAFPS
jgi:hypothetical protein